MEIKTASCQYKSFGCPVKVTPDLLTKHYEEDVSSHLNLATKALKLEESTKAFQKEASQCATRRCEDVDRANILLRRQLEALELFEKIVSGAVDPDSDPKNNDNSSEELTTQTAALKLEKLIREHKQIKEKVSAIRDELKFDKAQKRNVEKPTSPPQAGLEMAKSAIYGYSASNRKYLTPGERTMLNLEPLNAKKTLG
mmetsp:Transcript_19803/g.27875  ORF Transcript_19803/g.27875 Transcript_19803/m.27875 type:complete len:198 (+) Transcript_19803:129-722(+)|eukprot:CAMPEP_0185261304 /NCGR_PEP_ID=MMETSP1359-20130426/9714_1 /TAXON_ID=552665 /ORGANISM="Bigelowiella longifila, Strain CCMP242" /LENGTH=197 /DNA_ID=CAMNT_0027847867 /DNA_START=129 /DNA_END=722 /DNA_ORIENTATION=-